MKSPRIPVRLTILPLVLALGACAFAPTASRPPRRSRPSTPARRRRHGAGVAQHYEQGAQPVPQWKALWLAQLDALVEEGWRNPDLAATGRSLAAAASSCAARSTRP